MNIINSTYYVRLTEGHNEVASILWIFIEQAQSSLSQ
ncbi:MAG: hypothetical protein BMS9Abin08_0601 [Gammaproteobacteria bacterium]|nr:MAG: hypothetical protein BMS9Abin08_0601 [Gammaproteobacteria bacterium]